MDKTKKFRIQAKEMQKEMNHGYTELEFRPAIMGKNTYDITILESSTEKHFKSQNSSTVNVKKITDNYASSFYYNGKKYMKESCKDRDDAYTQAVNKIQELIDEGI